jgi:hypothetical protein
VANFSDTVIRDQQDLLLKRLAVILERFEFLDDPERILRGNPKVLKDAIEKYGDKLGILTDYFTGNVVNVVVANAARSIEKNLQKVDVQYRMAKAKKLKLVRELKKEYGSTIQFIINELVEKQVVKTFQYRALTDLLAVPPARQIEQFRRVGNVIKIGGKDVVQTTAEGIWETMTQKYGEYDKILFAPRTDLQTGRVVQHKMFLNRYVEGKSITMSQEGHTATTQIAGLDLNIQTATIAPNGTKDSCILHERKVFFLSEAQKKVFMAEYGDEFPQAKSWKTIQEVKQDRTHMLKFNCRHLVDLLPVQFLPDRMQESLPKSSTIPRTNKELQAQTDEQIKERANA